MSVRIDIAQAGTIPQLQEALRHWEDFELELVSLSAARFSGAIGNAAVFRRREPGSGSPAPLTLVEVDSSKTLVEQRELVDAQIRAGRRFVCFGGLRLGAEEKNVAAFRG